MSKAVGCGHAHTTAGGKALVLTLKSKAEQAGLVWEELMKQGVAGLETLRPMYEQLCPGIRDTSKEVLVEMGMPCSEDSVTKAILTSLKILIDLYHTDAKRFAN